MYTDPKAGNEDFSWYLQVPKPIIAAVNRVAAGADPGAAKRFTSVSHVGRGGCSVDLRRVTGDK